MRTWVDALAPYYGEHLLAALDFANKKPRMPSLGEVIEDIEHRRRKAANDAMHAREADERRRREYVSPEEQERRDRAADEFFAAMRRKLGYRLDNGGTLKLVEEPGTDQPEPQGDN